VCKRVKVFVSRSTFQPAATRGGNAIYCGGIRAIDSEPRGGARQRVICPKPGRSVIVLLCFLSGAERCAKRDAEREKRAEKEMRSLSLRRTLMQSPPISPGGRSRCFALRWAFCGCSCLAAESDAPALFGWRRAMLRRSESIWAINFPSSPAFLRFHCWQSECAVRLPCRGPRQPAICWQICHCIDNLE
jgi:hypothetical protein